MPRPRVVKALSDIKVDEISLVDRAANQLARVLISKRLDDDISKESPTASALHHERPLTDDERKRKKKRRKRFGNDDTELVTVRPEDELAKADDDEDDELAALLEAVAARRKRKRQVAEEEPEEEAAPEDDPLGLLEEEEGEEDEFDLEEEEQEEDEEEEGGNPFGEEEEEELGDELPADEQAEDEPKPMPGDLPPEVGEYVDVLERTVDELERRFKEQTQGEVAKSGEEVEVSEDTIAKEGGNLTDEEVSFLEELTKSFEDGEVDADEVISKALEEVRKAQQRAEEATELAKAERDLRLAREFIAKVHSEFPHLPLDPNELGPVLKAAKDALSDEHWQTLEKALAANDAILKSLGNGEHRVSPFSEVGKRGGATPASTEVDTLADEMVTKGEAKSHEEAVAKLYQQRPELYDDYLADNTAQAR